MEKDKIITAEREDSLSLEELCAAGDQSLELETGQNVELEPCLVKPRIGLEQDQITGVKQWQNDENVESLSLVVGEK